MAFGFGKEQFSGGSISFDHYVEVSGAFSIVEVFKGRKSLGGIVGWPEDVGS